jgi:molybdenum cofactor cytidylyltransferase
MLTNFRLSLDFIKEAAECGRDPKCLRVEDIFFPMPCQWGLRGDSYLWAALAAYMATDLDEIDFATRFHDAFLAVSGLDFDTAPEEFLVERLMHGGMSSGVISMTWWRETGYPLLASRFEALEAAIEMIAITPSRRVASVFFPMPEKWGLRGDPYLWAALSAYLGLSACDQNFDTDFRHAFKHLTNQDFDRASDTFFVETFAHGGMSSGAISMEWWRETGLPLLKQRIALLGGEIPPRQA